MLETLHIRGYALIDSLDLNFGDGLTAITGETGAGKSIIISAIGVALGARISTKEIRTGADSCEVTAVFDPQLSGEVDRWLSARSIDLAGEALILRRVARRRGRGSSFVQSIPVPLSDYGELGRLLLSIHGQHQHQSLLSAAEQRRLLDRYMDVEGQVASIGADNRRLTELRDRQDRVRRDIEHDVRDRELLQHSVEEINRMEIRDGEAQELTVRRNLLRNAEKIQELLATSRAAISEVQGGAAYQLRAALQAIGELAAIDDRYEALVQQVETTLYEVEDVCDVLSKFEDNAVDPGELLLVDDRLQTIRAVTRKYKGTEAGTLAHAEECRRQLTELESVGEKLEEVAAVVEALERSIKAAAEALSLARQGAATELQSLVQQELRQLGMPQARFSVGITSRREGIGATGMDAVEFLLEANPGEGFSPLRSFAAGGELSRVMLALNAVPARAGGTMTTAFDEIDAGVGGQAGVAIGERLRSVARRQQVLCITHLATVAARADTHLMVEKRRIDDRNAVVAGPVDGDERVDELARMLTGDRSEGVPRQHALLLLSAAHGQSD